MMFTGIDYSHDIEELRKLIQSNKFPNFAGFQTPPDGLWISDFDILKSKHPDKVSWFNESQKLGFLETIKNQFQTFCWIKGTPATEPKTFRFRFPSSTTKISKTSEEDFRKFCRGQLTLAEMKQNGSHLSRDISIYFRFLLTWIIRDNPDYPEDHRESLRNLINHYMQVDGYVSVPEFLVPQLSKDLSELSLDPISLKIKWSLFDTNPTQTQCPICYRHFFVAPDTTIHHCEVCNSDWFD